MNTVQPIRDTKTISRVKELLRAKDEKYYIMFVLGLNTGLRISDILSLKAGDLVNKTHASVLEKKTGKTKRLLINEQLQKEITAYVKSNNMNANDYMVVSRKGDNKPITRVQAYRVLNDIANELGLQEIGTHTMRKTFGYWHYKQHKDVAILQDIFNHSAPSVTLRYIGINDDMKDATLTDFFL